MEFEWDDVKDVRNARVHGVAFREAATSFYDPLARLQQDEGHSSGEERFVLIGQATTGRLLITVFTERRGNVRVISSRRATRREARAYEEGV